MRVMKEERLRQGADLAGLGLYTWDPTTGALEWDERIRGMWGLGADAPVNHRVWLEAIHPEDRAAAQAALARCLEPDSGGIYEVNYRVNGADGVMRWVRTRGRTRFVGGRPSGHMGVAVDVTHERALQEELERLVGERTARSQELVEELEHFSYTLAHDMRAPLRSMMVLPNLPVDRGRRGTRKRPRSFYGRLDNPPSGWTHSSVMH